jgi:transposase, IS5 family
METVPMRPAKPDHAEQPDMFRETLEAILDPRHELLELGRRIDWAGLDAVCGETFVDQVGRPAHAADGGAAHPQARQGPLGRGGLHGLGGEPVLPGLSRGARFFQHRLPLDRSSMTRWRQRIGAERLETLLADSLAIAQDSGAVVRDRVALRFRLG